MAGTFSSLHRNKTRKTENLDFGEISAGYFTRLSDNRVLEVYLGAGGGATERIERNAEKVTERTLDGSLSKIFAQVNYARKKRENLRLFGHEFPLTYGAAMRMSYMQLNNFRINGQAGARRKQRVFRAHHLHPHPNSGPRATAAHERPDVRLPQQQIPQSR
ncbi:hypothetical protein ACFQT0_25020 [Hymenobacter humi]|uniref:Uncharacterized protein n=1 Tax=Hymenobacter humi TaxID=1411620 RepID=A0ABW2U9T4_9BACT